MTPERWRRVGELFQEGLEIPADDRSGWLDQSCGADTELRREVLSLLESDRAAGQGFVRDRLKSAFVSFQEVTTTRRAGPYRLTRELGRGGMGTVYLAERDDDQYQTQVAVKLVRPGMDTDFILRRFLRERQILAHLQHPHIARLLDGGTTDEGLPYIVMEYISGAWITDYCREHNLDIQQRVKLFVDVCTAVEYAHQHFVVHRDLKPGNILVDGTGSVKLLDFGICKLLVANPLAASETVDITLRLLTPDYASPEQVRGDPITISSDIYSLAAVLYELLTGVKPHRITDYQPMSIERIICDQEITRPSEAASPALARRLRGDLDVILMRALDKEPQRRYPSVERFAEDLRRYLAFQPVLARPDTLTYRFLKFTRRRRGTVAAIAAVILSLLAGGLVAAREARIANENLNQVRRLANTFVFEVHDAVRDLPGSTKARQLIVETGLKYLDALARNARGDRLLQIELARAYQRIGDVQGDVLAANLGNTNAAFESYRKALALLDAAGPGDSPGHETELARLTLLQRLGGVYSYTEDRGQALSSYREAIQLGEDLTERYPQDRQIRIQLAEIHLELGDVLRRANEYDASLEENSKGLKMLLDASQRDAGNRSLHNLVATAYSNAGMSEIRLGRLADALDHFRRSVVQMEDLVRQEPGNVKYQRGLIQAYSHLGDVLGSPNMPNLGDPVGALRAYQQIQDIARRLHEADPADHHATRDYAIALARVAGATPDQQREQRAVLCRESVRLLEEVARVNPQNLTNRADLAHGENMLGDALLAVGDRPGAVRSFRQALDLAESMLNKGQAFASTTLVSVCLKLGQEAAGRGERDVALTYARRALEVTDPASKYAKSRPEILQRTMTPRGLAAMGLVYRELARSGDAEDVRQAVAWLEKSVAAWREVASDPSFSPPRRRELEQVELALSELQHRRVR